jgi:hypothetical protein
VGLITFYSLFGCGFSLTTTSYMKIVILPSLVNLEMFPVLVDLESDLGVKIDNICNYAVCC